MLEESQAHPDAGGLQAFSPPPLDPAMSRGLIDNHLGGGSGVTWSGLDLQHTRPPDRKPSWESIAPVISKAAHDHYTESEWTIVLGSRKGQRIGKNCHSEGPPPRGGL